MIRVDGINCHFYGFLLQIKRYAGGGKKTMTRRMVETTQVLTILTPDEDSVSQTVAGFMRFVIHNIVVRFG